MSDRIDFEQVREVIRIAEESGLASLEVATPALTVRVARAAAPSAQPGTVPAAGTAGTELGATTAAPTNAQGGHDHLEPVVAPMVGTFYRASSPDAVPFVNEGDYVAKGQVVCVIEAMKLFNEIQAERAGRLARVLVDNATPVEYGQPLFLLDVDAARSS
jgi:acetyl-CoA carboxylase biotin carboxyl carrier protein